MSKIPNEVDSVQKLLDYFESHQTLWDKITMPFYRVRNFIREKWWEFRQRCQRFKRGFAWGDVWDMDAWFISTAKPMLEHLLKKHWGHPCNIENEK